MTDELPNEPISRNPGDNEPSPQLALESAAGYVAASTAAGTENFGIHKAFTASFEAILHWAETNKIIRLESDFPFLRTIPQAEGKEHSCWFDESSNRWFKATRKNEFGLAWGRTGSATACEYLNRLVLQNKHFGDDIHLIALVNCSEKLRVLTSQPHIFGDKADRNEIQHWFRELGFIRFESNGSIAWYRYEDNLLAADAHEGNVIRSINGGLYAIDLNLVHPNDEIRALIIAMLELT